MKMKKLLLVLTTILVLTLSACGESESYMNRYSFFTEEFLDTQTKILIYHEDDFDINELKNGINEILSTTHNIYDSHTDTSEVGKLNLVAHNGPVEVSDELYVVIKEALRVAEESDGAYDPTITPLVELWDIDDDSKWSGRTEIPSEEAIQAALANVDYKKVVLNDSDQTVEFTQEGITLDLGGISKGYIAQLLKEYIVESGIEHAIINVGNSSQIPIGTRCAPLKDDAGNVVMRKGPDGVEVEAYVVTEDPWKIGTDDPFDLFGFNPPVGVFGLKDVALSSSGSAERFFIVEDTRYHHIFDTKTGYPADNEMIVIQVTSPNVVGIDALSTMLYVMGLEEALKYVETHEGVEAIFITYDKEVILSSGFGDYQLYNAEFILK